MSNDREDSGNEVDDQVTGEETDEQRAAALRTQVKKAPESSSAPAAGDDIIIK